jgi:hypothetical protein
VRRFAALTFGAVLLATAILAVLGYLSLRHWEASAELLFREQARDMAAMAAEKIEMTRSWSSTSWRLTGGASAWRAVPGRAAASRSTCP